MKTSKRVVVYLQVMLAAMLLTCLFGAHTVHAMTDQEKKNSAYGFFVWLSKNEELSEADKTDAAVAAQLLTNSVSEEYRQQVFNTGTNPGMTIVGDVTNYQDVLPYTSIGQQNDATDLDRLRDAVEYIERGNEYRAKESLPALKISSALMAMSEINANYQDSVSKLTHTRAFFALENLARSTAYSTGDISVSYYDPYDKHLISGTWYDGWYYGEKEKYEAGDKDNSGHYITLTDKPNKYGVKTDMRLTGFGFTYREGKDGSWNKITQYFSQHFSDDSRLYSIGDGFTPDEYLSYLARYKCTLEGHEIDTTNATIITPATCLEDGLQSGRCKKCGETVEEVIPALGHKMQKTEAKAATCTEDGNTEYHTCSQCNKLFSDDEGKTEIALEDTVVPALGHKMQKTEAKAATCTAAGNIEYYTCSRCKKIFSDEEGKTEITQEDTVVPALGHKMRKTEAKAATCTEAGNIEYYTCSRCEKLFSDEEGKTEIAQEDTVVPALGHKMQKTEAKAATCTEAGNKEYYTCSQCNKRFSDEEGKAEIAQEDTVVPALGHKMQKTEAKAATCTEAGNKEYYTCSQCNKIFSDEEGKAEIAQEDTVVPALGHKMQKTEAKAATCTEAGNKEYYTCSQCNKLFSDEEGKAEIAQEETVIVALGHNLTLVAAKGATCKEEGNTEHYACSRCRTLFSDAEGKNQITREEVVIKVAHVLEKTDAEKATCTEDGNIEYYTCTVCGKVFSDEEGKTETSLDDTVIKASHVLEKTDAREATCSEDGNIEYYTCSRCEKVFSDKEGTKEIPLSDVVIKARHDLMKTDAKEATCTEEGNREYYTCSRCKKLFSDNKGKKEITQADTVEAALGHDLQKIDAKEATCSDDGNIEYYTCSRCGKLFSDEEGKTEIAREDTVLRLDHEMEKTEAKAATCTEEGNIEYYTCSQCHKIFFDKEGKTEITQADTVIAKKDHTWSDWSIVTPATISSTGTKERTCSLCGEKETQEIPKKEEPKAADGTAVGKGASAAAAEAAIVNGANEEGPSGTTFAQLSAKVKKAKKTSITLTWNRVAPKYIIYGNKCGKGQKYKKITTVAGTSFTQKGLAKGTYYKYMVVAVDAGGRVVATSKTMHAATSGKKVGNPKKVTVKKKTLKLKRGKTAKIKASIVKPKGKKVKNHRKLAYESVNPKVATVAKNGKVKAVSKGTTYIYVYAQNGVYAKVKVIVK